MNEQHYTITLVSREAAFTTFNIKANDGYYLTKDSMRYIDEYYELHKQKDLSYNMVLWTGDADISSVIVNPIEEEVIIPNEVKQKIMDEQYTIDVTCDIPEINAHIDGINYMQDCSFDIDRYIEGQGVIGGFVANEFNLTLKNFTNIDLTGYTLNVNVTINYETSDGSHSLPLQVGLFTISECKYDDTTGTHKIKAYDNALLYNIDYVPSIEFPCTVIELLNDVLLQTKQSLKGSETRYVYTIPVDGLPMGQYYFTVNNINYGFEIDELNEDEKFNNSIMFDGEHIIIREVHEDSIIYMTKEPEVLQDTTDYTQLVFKQVQYVPFNNDLFVVPSNQFDVTTTTNQNDQSIEVKHANCRNVVQDIAKTMFGWAYITPEGELAFANLKPALQDNHTNLYMRGQTIQSEPLDPSEPISPNNPAEVQYFSWGQSSGTYNYGYIGNDTEQIEKDGLMVQAVGSAFTIGAGTSTNIETSINKWDVNYLLPEDMFIRYYNDNAEVITIDPESQIKPYIKYVHDNEIIISNDTVTLLKKGDRVIEIGYSIEPNTELSSFIGVGILFATMENFENTYVPWDGEYAAYGLLGYIDEDHYDALEYIFDKTNPYYGYVMLTYGAYFVIGAQMQWSYDSTNELFSASLPTIFDLAGLQIPITAADGTSIICKYYEGNTPGSSDDYYMYVDNNTLYVKNKDLTSMDEWNAWLYTVAQDFIITYALEQPLNLPIYPVPQVIFDSVNNYDYYEHKYIMFTSLGSEYVTVYKTTNTNPIFGTIDTNHYITSKQETEQTTPINRVLIGLKDIEGENVYIGSDDATEDSTIAIYDNNITYTPELRTMCLQEGASELFDFYYVPLEIDMPGMPWLQNCEPYIFNNVDNDTFVGYAFKSHFDYKGFIKQKLSSKSTTSVQSEYAYDSSYTSALNQTRYIVDKQNQQITSLIKNVKDNTETISNITQTVRDWTAEFESVGGNNYIKNSVGLGDATNLEWVFTADSDTSSYAYGTTSDASLFTKSGSRWYIDGYNMKQTVNVLQDATYSFACKIKKPIDTLENCYIRIYDTTNPTNMWEIIPDPAKEYNFEELRLSGDNSIQPQTTNITIEVYASEGCQLTISDIMLNSGNMCSTWTPAAGEILTTNVKMDAGGLRVLSTDYVNNGLGDYTIMTPSYFRGYGNNNGTEECVFQVSGTKTMTFDSQVKNSQTYGNADSSHYNVKVIPVTNSNYDGIAFIKSKGE